jgi:hypothetical protein
LTILDNVKLSKQSFRINFATLGVLFTNKSVSEVSFDYEEGTSLANVITINGKPFAKGTFVGMNGKTINGISVKVTQNGKQIGSIILSGCIQDFALNGVELSIDNLCWKS